MQVPCVGLDHVPRVIASSQSPSIITVCHLLVPQVLGDLEAVLSHIKELSASCATYQEYQVRCVTGRVTGCKRDFRDVQGGWKLVHAWLLALCVANQEFQVVCGQGSELEWSTWLTWAWAWAWGVGEGLGGV